MTNAKAELVRSWLTKARHDLASARVLAASELALLDTAIYHCQQVPSCKTRFAAEVMVGEGVSPLTATTEPDVRLSPHPALEHQGHCHWYYHREYHREYSWQAWRGSTARVPPRVLVAGLSWQAWRGWR